MLPALKTLVLSRISLTGAALQRLKGMRRLDALSLQEGGLSEAEVQELKRALPRVKIEVRKGPGRARQGWEECDTREGWYPELRRPGSRDGGKGDGLSRRILS